MRQKTIQILSIGLLAALLVWGVYTLLFYLGVPVHKSVLLRNPGATPWEGHCSSGSMVCQGLYILWPFIKSGFRSLGPLTSYAIFSGIFFMGFCIWRGFRTGFFGIQGTMRPWHVVTIFFLSVFLIFSGLSFGKTHVSTTSGGHMAPLRRIVEPTTQVYKSTGEEGLERLKRNFKDLQDAGCLTANGKFSDAASQFLISPRCMYSAFVTRIFSQMLFIFGLLFEMIVLGRFLLTMVFRLRPKPLILEAIFSVALGACGLVTILWSLAVLGLLSSTVGWMMFLLLPAVLYKHSVYWLKQFVHAEIPVQQSWYSMKVLLVWLLISYVAFNFLAVVRPFPIGWDDLGSYLNRPRLMVSYGHFIFSMAQFQWEYLTSLGFLLFGYSSDFGATASLMINWMAGVLAVCTVVTFGRMFIGPGRGILAGILFYFLPVIGHFSFADMKIDNAVFTMGALCMLAVFLYLFGIERDGEREPQRDLRWIILAGVLGGFAFSMKATAVMVIFASLAILSGVLLHWTAFVGVIMLAGVAFVLKRVLDITKIMERIGGIFAEVSNTTFMIALLVIAIPLFGYAMYHARARLVSVLKTGIVFCLCAAAVIVPWIIHNNYQVHGSIIGFEFGSPNKVTPSFNLSGKPASASNNLPTRSLPPEIAVDLEHPHCSPSGNKEELDRYWGFGEGLGHYLKLPWRMVMNLDSGGYYVTTIPALLLFPLLLLLPFFWMKKAQWLRWMFLGTIFIIFEWIFLANGVIWYGVGMFLGLALGLEMLLARAPDRLSRTAFGTLLALSVLIMVSNRMWQFEMQRNVFEYPMGKVTAAALKERTIPHYNDIADIVVSRKNAIPDRPFLYRIGTFIPYFIPKNLEIIALSDHQLDMFNCLHQERDAALTTKRLKALGFNSIVFDTNTHTIEKDPQGSLHKKVELLVNYLNDPESGVQPVLNDPGAGVAFILIP